MLISVVLVLCSSYLAKMISPPIAMRMTKSGRKERKKREKNTHVSHPPYREPCQVQKKKGNGDEITNAMELPRDHETRGINLKKKKRKNDKKKQTKKL